MVLRQVSLVAIALFAAAGAAKADTVAAHVTQVANLPDDAQGDAAVASRHIISGAPLAWPRNVSGLRQADVIMRYTIEPDGHVDQVRVLEGAGTPFADAAVAAVTSRVYSPAASATTDVETMAKFHPAPHKAFGTP